MFNYQKSKEKRKKEKEKKKIIAESGMSQEEYELVNRIIYCQNIAEEQVESLNLDDIWEDNHKMYTGNHWDVSMISRTREEKKHRYNMVKNHIRSTINNIRDNLAMTTPESVVDALEEEKTQNENMQQQLQPQQNIPGNNQQQLPNVQNMQIPNNIMQQIAPLNPAMTRTKLAEEVTCMLKHNDNVDNLKPKYRRALLMMLNHGGIAIEVIFDNDFIGGSGPERWQGDIRTNFIDKEEFFPDPAIIDLENDLQKCEFINIKLWTKIKYINDTWDKNVSAEVHEDYEKETGSNPTSAYIVRHYHRGKPHFMPEKRKKYLLNEASKLSKEGDYYKSKMYEKYANEEVDGIHLAIIANGVFLEYIPYIYEHGLYPLAYRTRFINEDNPRGDGEIEDLKLPQLAIDKAEENMLSALSKQGLGNIFVRAGSMSTSQKRSYINNNSKGSSIHEVDDITGIREQAVNQISGLFMNYIQSQEFFMEKSSSVTAIQKGISPGSNVPLGTVKELGSRTDIKTRSIALILKELFIERDKFRIKLMAQFYTEDRYYRLKGDNGKIKTGKLSKKDMMFQWDRIDENGKPYKEWFVPEFDLDVRVLDEMPQERDYHVNTAMAMLGQGLITKQLVWETIEKGKLPNKNVALDEVKKLDTAAAESAQAQIQREIQLKQIEFQHELQMKQMELEVKKMELQLKQQESQRKNIETLYNKNTQDRNYNLEERKVKLNEIEKIKAIEKEDNPDALKNMLQQYYPDIYNNLMNAPEDVRNDIIGKIMQTSKENLPALLKQIQEMITQYNTEAQNEKENMNLNSENA